MMKFGLSFVALALLSSAALADDMMTTTPQTLKWGPAPDAFANGGQIAVIAGDPSKSGPYVLRFKMPNGYKIAPHFHPTTENVTVISGTFHVGSGDKFDPKSGTALKAGGFLLMPANMHHYAWTSGSTVIQVHGDGPFQITYINAADDPRTKK
jgi:quercetin dioxygenase-like cupin family protein